MLFFTQLGDVFEGSSKVSALLIKDWFTLGLIHLLILGQLWCDGDAYLHYGKEIDERSPDRGEDLLDMKFLY